MLDSPQTLETIFSACGALAMLGWAGLVLLPRVPFVVDVLSRLIIPALIGVVYLTLMISSTHLTPADGGFGSLAGVKALFSVDALLLGGWVHYLAFDLFVGSWEVRDAKRRGVHHLLVIPCLLATFMAGPAGLVLYLLLRTLVGFFGNASERQEAVAS
jgi:hypothetical protein